MFREWRGPRWGEWDNALGGARILVLGESHYSDIHEVGSVVPDMTEWMASRYLSGEIDAAAKRFCTRIANTLAPAARPGSSANDIWESIVFYNFIPVVLAEGAHAERPTDELWRQGRQPFMQVLRRVEAEAVLVLGNTLWHHMEWSHDQPAPSYGLEGETRSARRYTLHEPPMTGTRRAVAAHVPHPTGSRGFSPARWAGVVEYLVAEIRAARALHGDPPLGGASSGPGA